METDSRGASVSIRVTTRQTDSAGQTGQGTSRIQGEMTREDGQVTLRYREDPGAGMGHCETTVILREDGVQVLRDGEVRARQVFLPGKTTRCRYGTPYGEMDLAVRTDALRWCEEDWGLELHLEYGLTLNGQETGDTQLQMVVTHCGDNDATDSEGRGEEETGEKR